MNPLLEQFHRQQISGVIDIVSLVLHCICFYIITKKILLNTKEKLKNITNEPQKDEILIQTGGLILLTFLVLVCITIILHEALIKIFVAPLALF